MTSCGPTSSLKRTSRPQLKRSCCWTLLCLAKKRHWLTLQPRNWPKKMETHSTPWTLKLTWILNSTRLLKRNRDETLKLLQGASQNLEVATKRCFMRKKIKIQKKWTNSRCSLTQMACLRITQTLTSQASPPIWPTRSFASSYLPQRQFKLPSLRNLPWLRRSSSSEDSLKFRTRSIKPPVSLRSRVIPWSPLYFLRQTRWIDSFLLGWRKPCKLNLKLSVWIPASSTRPKKTFHRTLSSSNKITPIFLDQELGHPKFCSFRKHSKAHSTQDWPPLLINRLTTQLPKL